MFPLDNSIATEQANLIRRVSFYRLLRAVALRKFVQEADHGLCRQPVLHPQLPLCVNREMSAVGAGSRGYSAILVRDPMLNFIGITAALTPVRHPTKSPEDCDHSFRHISP